MSCQSTLIWDMTEKYADQLKNEQCRYDSRISVPGAFNLDHLEPFEPVLNQLYLTPNLNHVKAHFLSLREGREGRQMISNYLHNTTIALVMGWSNGSVVKFLLRVKEKVKNKQCRYDSRISVPGAFNLDHLEPFEPILNQLYLTPQP